MTILNMILHRFKQRKQDQQKQERIRNIKTLRGNTQNSYLHTSKVQKENKIKRALSTYPCTHQE